MFAQQETRARRRAAGTPRPSADVRRATAVAMQRVASAGSGKSALITAVSMSGEDVEVDWAALAARQAVTMEALADFHEAMGSHAMARALRGEG